MKKGLKVRFHDVESMLKLNPDVYEFHLSDKDLDYNFPDFKYEQELVCHGPEYWNRKLIDLCSKGETNQINSREVSVQIIQRALDLTNKIAKNFKGQPKFVLHPGGMSMDPMEDTKESWELLHKSMSELRPGNVIIMLENMPPYPWFFGGQWHCNIFLDAVSIKNFLDLTGGKMCFDLCHAQLYCNTFDKDILEQIKILNPYIAHVHISDADGYDGEGLQIDEGKIDFVNVLANLRKDVAVIPEIWRGHEHEGEGFKVALERLKKYE